VPPVETIIALKSEEVSRLAEMKSSAKRDSTPIQFEKHARPEQPENKISEGCAQRKLSYASGSRGLANLFRPERQWRPG